MNKPFGAYGLSFGQIILYFLIKRSLLRGKPAKALARKLWRRLSKTPNVEIYDVQRWGIRLRLNFASNYMENVLLFNYRTYEGAEIDFFKNRLSDGEVFADIGANMGYWSLMLARVFPNTEFLCFEPNPIVYERLQTNIALNGWGDRIHAYPCAISDNSGTATLTTAPDGTLGNDYSTSSIDEDRLSHIDTMIEPEHFVNVKTGLLADFAKTIGHKKIDAIKMDVEGHEVKALMPYLRSIPPADWPHTILLEDTFAEDWQEDIFSYLLEGGYQILHKRGNNVIFCR